MNNEVSFQVNVPLINKSNYDYLNNINISNESENAVDNYEDFEFIMDSDNSDLSLPINNIGRMMKLSIPGSAKISRESKMLMQQISKDFIGCISSQAGEICTSNKRRVLNGEDIINALSSFGFGDYTGTLINYLNVCRGLKQSRNIKSFSNIYKSNNSLFNFNENYQIPTAKSQHQFSQNDKNFEYNYSNTSQINNQKSESNEYNKYFIQSNSSINTQQVTYTNFPKYTNNAIYDYENSNIDNNINPHKYSKSNQENINITYSNNNIQPNKLLISPKNRINFFNESSPITPKSIIPLNQCGKRKRIGQEEFHKVNIINNIEQNINSNIKYNMNYNINNLTNTELIENNKFQENIKLTNNSFRYNNTFDFSSNQYKQDDVFLSKNESSFDKYFSSDLYTQDEIENCTEYYTYPTRLFIS